MKPISKWGVFALLLTSSLTIMVGTVIAPSLTVIAAHLKFSSGPGWLVTLPSLGVVLFAPVAGRWIDRKGAYRVMCWGLVPYALLGLAGAALPNPYLLIADRLLLGAATAAIQASGTSLIAELFEGKKRMQMIAWQGMAIELGGVLFLSIGGLLGEHTWYYPFFIYLIALLCLLLLTWHVPESPAPVRRHTLSTQKEIISQKVLAMVACSAFAMILFFVAFVGLPLFLPYSFHFSQSYTGYFMALISLIAVGAASQMPKAAGKIGNWQTLALGFVFLMTGLFLFYLSGSLPALLLAALAMGGGFGFTVPLLNHMVVEESSALNRGRNLGYYSMGIFGGQFFSSFITELSGDVRRTFLWAALLALLVALAIFLRFRVAINSSGQLDHK
ncbi:MAG: MFS transporter [Hymenobacter sp.]|nr:MAG: MFS transporter [Hymenobacter sp.]